MFHGYPQTPAYPTIIEAVGDDADALATWREVCGFWMMRGYNRNNLEGLLDAFGQEWAAVGKGFEVKVIDGVEYQVFEDGSRVPITANP